MRDFTQVAEHAKLVNLDLVRLLEQRMMYQLECDSSLNTLLNVGLCGNPVGRVKAKKRIDFLKESINLCNERIEQIREEEMGRA